MSAAERQGAALAAAPAVRVDKWLHVARVFKTRSLATHACELGRVTVNGAVTKAHRHLVVGDRVEVQQGERQRILVVKVLRDRPIAKAEVPGLFEDLSPPPPAPDPLARLMRGPAVRREPGAGRPTKRARRDMERWEGGSAADRAGYGDLPDD